MKKEIYSNKMKKHSNSFFLRLFKLDKSASSCKENEEMFNIIVNNISEYIYSVKYEDGNPIYTYHSPKCIEITGYTPLDYITDDKLWLKMIYDEDRKEVEEFFSSIKYSDKSYKIEHRIVTKEKKVRWILNTCSCEFKNGEIISQNGIILDITERKVMEEALKNSERRFRSLLENGSDIIALISMNCEILYISPSVMINLGYDPESLTGTSYLELVHPADKYLIYQSISQLLTDHNINFTIKYKIRDFNGNFRVYETKGSVVKDSMDSIVLNSRDVTEIDEMLTKLEELALYDELTGLYNRRGFKTLAEQQIKVSNRTGRKLYMFFIDMDNMKKINDKYGHESGDMALIKTRDILNATFRESDIVSRIGGDEFVALILESHNETDISLYSRLTDVMNKLNSQSELPYSIELSVGVAVYDPKMPCTYEELLRKADLAMYNDKQKKKY